MKKLIWSRPGWPSSWLATSIRVSPIEMSMCPASSKTVQRGRPEFERFEQRVHSPLVVGEARERVAHALQFALERVEHLSERPHRHLP